MPNPTPTPAGMTAEQVRAELVALNDFLGVVSGYAKIDDERVRLARGRLTSLAARLSGMTAEQLREYSADNWAHQALIKMDAANGLCTHACVTMEKGRYDRTSAAFWEVVQMLVAERDRIEAARLSGMAAVPAWQPIETAPRDGTEIVVCWPKVEIDDDCELTNKAVGYVRAVSSFADGAWVEPEFFEANGPAFDDDWDFAMSPSHWMTLPAAPEPPHV